MAKQICTRLMQYERCIKNMHNGLIANGSTYPIIERLQSISAVHL